MPSLRLHRLLIAASLVGPAGLFAAATLHNRSEVLREGEATVARTAAVMDEHARKVFETGELVLGRVDDHIRGLEWSAISRPETSAFLAQLTTPLEQIVSIWVADDQGSVRAGSQRWNPAATIADRDFFQVHRERDAGAYISTAFRGRATQVASFALSRRRSTADGQFDGTVHIALSPEYFTDYYGAVAPNLAHAAALVRSDGAILARSPQVNGSDSRHSADSPLMSQIASSPNVGLFSAVSGQDGTDRIYAYRKVGGYPLYVGFGVDHAALLRRWYSNLVLFGSAAGAASLTMLLVSWLALRSVKAQHATTSRLHSALSELQQQTKQR